MSAESKTNSGSANYDAHNDEKSVRFPHDSTEEDQSVAQAKTHLQQQQQQQQVQVQVLFNQDVRVILVPSRGEYKRHGICGELWWGAVEFSQFQAMASQEIKAYALEEGIGARAARRKLYQPSPLEIIALQHDAREQQEKSRKSSACRVSDHLDALAMPTSILDSAASGRDEGKDGGSVGLGLNGDDDDDDGNFTLDWKSPRSVQRSPPSPVSTELFLESVRPSPSPPLRSILKRAGTDKTEDSAAASYNNSGGGSYAIEKRLTGHSPRPVKPRDVWAGMGPNKVAPSPAPAPTPTPTPANNPSATSPLSSIESNAGCTPPPSLPSSAASSPLRMGPGFSPRPHQLGKYSDSESPSSSISTVGSGSGPISAGAVNNAADFDDLDSASDSDLSELAILPAITRTDSLHCVKSVPRGPPVLPPDDPTDDCTSNVGSTFGNGIRTLQSSSNMTRNSNSEESCNDDQFLDGKAAAAGDASEVRRRSSGSMDEVSPDTLTLCVPLDKPAKLRPEGQRRALAATRSFLGSYLGIVVGILVWLAVLGVILVVLIEKRSAAQIRAGLPAAPSQVLSKTVLRSWVPLDLANSNGDGENIGSNAHIHDL